MRSDEIIDVDSDPEAEHRAFWRRLLRIGLPAGGIVVVAAGLIASALYTNAMNKVDVLALSRDFIEALNARVHSEVQAYLDPAQAAVGSLAAMVRGDPLSEAGRDLFERLAGDLLRRHPQLAAAYLGTGEGEFFMVRRNEAGSADTKLIRQGPEGSRATWTRRDGEGRVTATEVDENDPYDPRGRDWFSDARPGEGIAWSEVYIFFTGKTPGITASIAAPGSGRPARAVVGVDIDLSTLSDFLAELQEEARGLLAIIDADGKVVAFHQPQRVMIESEAGPRPRSIRELGDPVLAEAFDRLRVEGPKRSIVEIDGERYVFGAASLEGLVSRDWWLVLLAPESAYTGFITANGRRGLVAASAIIALALVLAGLLAYQGLRGERRARALRAEAARQARERQIFDTLSGLSGLTDPADEHDLRRACALLAEAESARRVGIWRFSADGRGMVCLNAYEPDGGGHTSGTALQADDFEAVFAEIAGGGSLEIADAGSDPRAQALQLTYLQAVETTALTSLPIVAGERVLGAVWIEDSDPARPPVAGHSVARLVAGLMAPRMKAVVEVEAQMPAPGPKPAARRRAVVIPRGEGEAALPGEMLRKASLLDLRRQSPDSNGEALGATVYRDATVLALKLLDDLALAACPSGRSDGAVIREVVAIFKDAAEAIGVPYVKILTDQVLAVDGFEQDDGDSGRAEAAARLIDLALAVRERCDAIFLAAGIGPQFAMGVDSGTIFGSAVGFGDSPYNIWGEAVRVAITMANTAGPGTIQVSEATYELLREDCIFRRRGAFYLGPLGEMATFTLRGRL